MKVFLKAFSYIRETNYVFVRVIFFWLDLAMNDLPSFPGLTVSKFSEGTLGPLIRNKDWSQTSLGPMDSWPCSLKSYVSMILALPTPAIIFWGEDQVQIYNDGYAVIMGPRHPEHLGSKFRDCWVETFHLIDPLMKRVKDSGEVMTFERAPITVSRYGFIEEAHFSFTFSPLRDDSGNIFGVIQFVTEVTEQVLSERRLDLLRKISPTLGSLSPSIQEIVSTLMEDREDIRFALLFLPHPVSNKLRLAGSFGIETSSEGNVNLLLQDIVTEVYENKVPKHLTNIQELQPHAPEEPWPEYTKEAMVLTMRRNENSPTKGVIVLGISPRLKFDHKYRSFFFDVAREMDLLLEVGEQVCINEMIKESEKRFQAIIDHVGEGLVLADKNGNILLFNPSALKMHGFKSLDAMIKKISEYPRLFELYSLQGNIIALENWPIKRALRGERFFDYVVLVERTDIGRRFYASYSGSPIYNDHHEVKLAVLTIRDVTYRIKTEHDLKKAISARDEFLSIASHELKTPVTSLKLQLQVTQKAVDVEKNLMPSPERLARVLDVSIKQINRLSELIETLLDISRIQTGKLSLNYEALDLGKLTHEVLDRFTEQFENYKCPTEIDLVPDVFVMADRFRIEQVIINLLTNAMKYGAGRPVKIIVDKKNDLARIIVEDFGMGIEKNVQKKIFERFERAISADNISGLGLGLYICRQIVEAHGGTISVESELGKGSKFTVELKLHTES